MDETGVPAPVLLIARGGPIDGAERQLTYLAGGLDRRKFEPIVVLDREGPLAAHLRAAGVEVHLVPLRPWRSLRGIFRRHSDARRLADLAERRGVRLAHASDLWKSRYALFVAARLKIPGVVHIRGPVTPRDIAKHHLHQASAVVPIAERYCAPLAAGGIRQERIYPVDDAVDVERFRPDDARRAEFRRPLGIGDRLAVALVGRIERFKRTLEFLEIVACMPRALNAIFLIVGRTGEADYMRHVRHAVERHRLADRVLFTGRCEDMPETFAGLDILVTLSGGSVMFEAMACGKAVLSVRTDGSHSVHTRHKETAWCVTTDRAGPAGEALQRLIVDSALRQRLGAAARQWAERQLAPALLVERTENLYRRLIGLQAAASNSSLSSLQC